MSPEAEQSHDQRTRLNRDRVLHAGVALADEHGIEALSMRRLGNELGVEAMSLYNHVENKDDLLNGMIEIVVNTIELPDPGGHWKEELHKSSRSAHDTLVDHPWVPNMLMTPTAITPSRLRYMDAVLETLRSGGLSVVQTHHAFHAIETHTIGYTMQQVSFTFNMDELEQEGQKFLQSLPPDDFLYLAEHVRHHLDPGDDEQSAFEFGLSLILDGIERMRDA